MFLLRGYGGYVYVIGLVIPILLSACMQQVICPAFQSAFIHDQDYLRRQFSYFTRDSVPKTLTASKTKYLIAVPKSYRKRMKSLQTIEMKTIYPTLDSLYEDKNLGKSAASKIAALSDKDMLENIDSVDIVGVSGGDSTSVKEQRDPILLDSTYVITIAKEKYNVDQDIYMWYFRDILLLPDVRAKYYTERGKKKKLRKKGKKGKDSFLNKIFSKKNDIKDAPESIVTDSVGVKNTKLPGEIPEQEENIDTDKPK